VWRRLKSEVVGGGGGERVKGRSLAFYPLKVAVKRRKGCFTRRNEGRISPTNKTRKRDKVTKDIYGERGLPTIQIGGHVALITPNGLARVWGSDQIRVFKHH